jgi:hypothetical protein
MPLVERSYPSAGDGAPPGPGYQKSIIHFFRRSEAR